ncbi:MAG: hypothetical protein ACTSXE_04125 [Candidatus Thorarchaeota archaeon]
MGKPMQALFSPVSLVFILQALLLQAIWLYIGRISRNRYLTDIMIFQAPSSRLSRYYHWRVTSFENAFSEGIAYLLILIASLYGLGFALFDLEQVNGAFLIVLFVVLLSLMSALQHAWRVREVVDSENKIAIGIQIATDKIGVTSQMVDDLYIQGAMGDGRTWFALFKLAQRQDQVGWTVRDVLLEKGKEEDARFQSQGPESSSPSSSKDSGPDID